MATNMAHSQSKSPTKSDSFATGLLARFNASTKAAQDARRKAAVVQAEARKREEQRKEQEKKDRIRQEADRIVERNVPIGRVGKSTRRRASAPSRPKERHRRERPTSPLRKPRLRGAPPKALPGMEFVVRKTEKKAIKVPHSSDYSDMFGDQYLIGVDLAVTKQMARDTAAAAKENANILKERAERRKRRVKEAEEMTRKEDELRAKGLLTEKQRRRMKCAASAKDWLAVDQPVPMGVKRNEILTRPVGSESAPKVRSEKEAAKVAAKVSEREVSERKRQLRQRILAMGGEAKAVKKRAREEEDDDEPRKKRRWHSDDEEPVRKRNSGRSEGRRNGYSRREEEEERYTRREEGRYSRDRGYNSEEWSDYGDDDDDDDDDDEDLYGIEALEREEERSQKIAAMEDKQERKKELQRQKDKERRRRNFESKYE